MNEFEQRLGRVPLKAVPADWRKEILAGAEPAKKSHEMLDAAGVRTLKRTEVRAPGTSVVTRLHAQLCALLWPHPKAWGGLAAVWVVIICLNFSQRDEAPVELAVKSAPPTPEMTAELRAQQQLLAELLGPHEMSEADRPKMKPSQPRTQVVRILMG